MPVSTTPALSDESMAQPTAKTVLQQIFGFSQFREGQEKIINHLLHGDNVLAIMPTGGGKSLCYQIPAVLSETITVVISPLVALMDDQVAALRAIDVNAVCIPA